MLPPRVRILLIASTVAALAIFVFAYQSNSDPSTNSACNQPKAIDLLYPNCNTLAFQQAQVGVDMGPGYAVELQVNGIPIPLDQIQNRTAQSQVATRVAPDVFLFTPGPGKVVERLKPGVNSASVTYRKLSENDSTATTFAWVFNAN